jgi:hypothetical protein
MREGFKLLISVSQIKPLYLKAKPSTCSARASASLAAFLLLNMASRSIPIVVAASSSVDTFDLGFRV